MDDYIRRKDAKNAIQNALYDGTGYGEALDAVPAADVRPNERGTWIYYVDETTGMTRCKCSNCKTSYGCMDTPFCPNCGVDMGLRRGADG